MSGGRPLDPVWKHFIRDVPRCKARCRGCNKEMQALVERMKIHASGCPRLSSLQAEQKVSSQDHAGSSSGSTGEPSPKKFRQDLLPVPTSRPEEAINEQILRFFAAANVPFAASENVQFERLLQLLRPGTKPPSERSVGGKYLDSVYDQESTKLAERVRGRCVTLQVDGWSNLSGDPVIGIAFGFPGEVHLFETVDTTGLPHTVENLENLILPAIDRLEESFSVRVVAVCTDGASNMAGLRDAMIGWLVVL